MATDIDVEDENILTAIFKDSFPESWQDNPDFVQYLVELSSYGAERLAGEPDRLQEEKSQILSETQDLAFHNYSTFIQTADCSKEIFQDFQIIEKHLEGLVDKLPRFSDECDKVVLKAQEISSSRRMNSLTLQRHTQLLEVLEMPQLMDTCVRNGYYEEALELAAHVKRLERKHPNIPVIMGIVKEVKWSTQLMLNQLIQQLRTNLQLPACLKVIGFLRRMDVFTEAELRIKFLQARDSWFQSILDAIPTGDAYAHISKTVEASRVHLFDIMTQFRAIFSDEDPLISTGRVDGGVNEALLFHSWVMQKISQFLSTLEHDLEEGVGGRLDSIMGQCMYFGLSFSRVGADFRGLLAPIFERASLRYFQAAMTDANIKFEENMQSYNLLGVTTTGGLPFGASQNGQLYPPSCLLDFYPLAAYCNAALTAFNELRLCAPINLAGQIAESLQRSLQEVNRVILAFYRAEESTFNSAEKDQFEHFCGTYATDLLPYLNRCLQALFPPQMLATALGLSVSEVGKRAGLGQLNIPRVITPVQHLMPALPSPPSPSPLEPHLPASTVSASTAGDDDNVSQPQEQRSEPVPVSFTLDSDGEETPQENQRQDADNINSTSASSTITHIEPAPDTHTFTDSGVVSGDTVGGQTDSGLGSSERDAGSNPTVGDDGSTAGNVGNVDGSLPSNTEADVSDPGSASTQGLIQQRLQEGAGLTSNLPIDGGAVIEQSEAQPEVVDVTDKFVRDIASGSVGMSTTADGEAGGSWGDWGGEGVDLDNLDDMTLDGAVGDSTVDLDLLPTPSSSGDVGFDRKQD